MPARHPPPPGDRRSAARLRAVQALYQIDLNAAAADVVVDEFLTHRVAEEIDGTVLAAPSARLLRQIVEGATAEAQAIDALIDGAVTRQGGVKRLERVLVAILRAAVFELKSRPELDAAVVINEYVDLAHAYYAGAEPGLVNGILDRVARTLRPPGTEDHIGQADDTG